MLQKPHYIHYPWIGIRQNWSVLSNYYVNLPVE